MSIKFNGESYKVEKVFNEGRFVLLAIKEHVCKFECSTEEQALEYVARITNEDIVDLSDIELLNAWSQ